MYVLVRILAASRAKIQIKLPKIFFPLIFFFLFTSQFIVNTWLFSFACYDYFKIPFQFLSITLLNIHSMLISCSISSLNFPNTKFPRSDEIGRVQGGMAVDSNTKFVPISWIRKLKKLEFQ